MSETSLVEFIEQTLEQGDIQLPVFPSMVMRLRRTMAEPDYSIGDIAKVIDKDQVLTSNVLKMANSSFYAGLNPVTTIKEASLRLGAKAILNMVTVVTQEQLYQSKKKELAELMKPIWTHALGVAMASRWLAMNLGFSQLAEESFMAGLLHDIGKVLLLKIIEEFDGSGNGHQEISMTLVGDILETMHSERGRQLMAGQNMPEIYCQVAGMHHDPEVTGENSLLNIVRLANLVCHRIGLGLKNDPGLMLSTTPEAASLLAKDLVLAELQVKLEDSVNAIKIYVGSN
jgi:HD-like signal output (HDOD) protein